MTAPNAPKLQAFFDSAEATGARINLSASAIEPLSREEWLTLDPRVAKTQDDALRFDYSTRYGIEPLRAAIAEDYEGVDASGVMVTSGLDDGLASIALALVEPGDRVIVLCPCYPPQIELPRWRGAEVVAWEARAENGWVPSLDELRELLAPGARLVIVTFPQNPTGFTPDVAYASALCEMVEAAGATLVSDEVYSGLPPAPEAGVLPLCARLPSAISLHGLSKTYSLPGLRVGWMASANEADMARIRSVRNLMNCYLPTPVEALALAALRGREAIFARNAAIRDEGVAAADEFFASHDNLFAWQAPASGVLGFPEWRGPGSASALSQRLIEEAGIILAPSSCFEAGDRHFRVSVGRRGTGPGLVALADYLRQAL